MTSRMVLTRWGTADHLRLTRNDRLSLCPHEPQLLSPTTLIMLISKIIQQNPRYFSNSAILKMFGVTCGNQRIKDINSEDRKYWCCVHNCVCIPWHNIAYIYCMHIKSYIYIYRLWLWLYMSLPGSRVPQWGDSVHNPLEIDKWSLLHSAPGQGQTAQLLLETAQHEIPSVWPSAGARIGFL